MASTAIATRDLLVDAHIADLRRDAGWVGDESLARSSRADRPGPRLEVVRDFTDRVGHARSAEERRVAFHRE
jgi:hypothetical protein